MFFNNDDNDDDDEAGCSSYNDDYNGHQQTNHYISFTNNDFSKEKHLGHRI